MEGALACIRLIHQSTVLRPQLDFRFLRKITPFLQVYALLLEWPPLLLVSQGSNPYMLMI